VRFDWPLALAALAVVPLAAAAYVLADRRRAGTAARFATPALMPNIVARTPGRLRHVPIAVLLAGIALLVTGFARPHATISVDDEQATVMLVLDISRSMTADDVRPTRLVAAQTAASTFLETIPEPVRVGAVAFGTRANVVAPPSQDRDLVREALAQVRPGEGTALGEAILLALRAIASVPQEEGTEAPPATILLLSDGSQTQGSVTPAQAARRAQVAGVPIFTVVLGTPDGVVERQLTGGFTERIRVPPDPSTLRRIAQATDGQFFEVADEERLKQVYGELGSRLGSRDKDAEITVAFAGAGMVFLLAAGALGAGILRRLPS
jgi:Ca-activated chloride channel family protein